MKKGIFIFLIIISFMVSGGYAGDSTDYDVNTSTTTKPKPKEDSCTGWMPQPNGCDWRTCVDKEGKQYCQECCKNKKDKEGKCIVHRVKCE